MIHLYTSPERTLVTLCMICKMKNEKKIIFTGAMTRFHNWRPALILRQQWRCIQCSYVLTHMYVVSMPLSIAFYRYSMFPYLLCMAAQKKNYKVLVALGRHPVYRGRGVLPSFGIVGRFCGDDPRFGDFLSEWVPILYLNTIRLIPSFCKKNRFVSITFSSRVSRT